MAQPSDDILASRQFAEAKAFLAKDSNGTNLYDHISNVIYHLLENKPDDPLADFEVLSASLKAQEFHPPATLKDEPIKVDTEVDKEAYEVATARKQLFKKPVMEEDEDGEAIEPPEINDGFLPNIMEQAMFLEEGGVSFSREESYRIMLSMKKLVETNPLARVRLFGKILGTKGNYIIVESEYHADSWPENHEDGELPEDGEDEDMEKEGDDNLEEGDVPIIRPQVAAARPLPSETQTGPNKYTYWVCSYAGDTWRRLPPVTPQQIVAARQITKFFTGDLDAPVVSYPLFPGTEKNYLRAQIARIAANTHVCPVGFYSNAGEGSEGPEEEEDDNKSVASNPEYEAPEGLDDVAAWVHYKRFILPQGRTQFFAYPVEKDMLEEEGSEEGASLEEDGPEVEHGVPLLTSVVEDTPVEGMPAWSVRQSSEPFDPYNTTFLLSNQWPGAMAYAHGKKSACVYVGWGQKYLGAHYTPPLPPEPQQEYPDLDGIVERNDPTVSEEKEIMEKMRAVQGDGDDGEEDELSGETSEA